MRSPVAVPADSPIPVWSGFSAGCLGGAVLTAAGLYTVWVAVLKL